MRRSSLHVLVLLAAAGVIGLLAWGAGGGFRRPAIERAEGVDAVPTHLPLGASEERAGATLRGEPRADVPGRRGNAVIVVEDGERARAGIGLDLYGVGSDGHTYRTTREDGQVVLEDVPLDGSVVVVADAPPAVADPTSPVPRAVARITSATTRIQIADAMPIEVTFRDAETDAPLSGIAFALRAGSERREGAARRVRARHGDYCSFEVRVEGSRAWVAFDNLEVWRLVSRRARALRFEVPLRPEANVRLACVDEAGEVVTDARVAGVEVAGRLVEDVPPAEPQGFQWRVRGVPYLRDEVVRVLAVRPRAERRVFDEDRLVALEEAVGRAVPPANAWWHDHGNPTGLGAIARGRLPPQPDDPLVLRAAFDPAPDLLRALYTHQGYGSGKPRSVAKGRPGRVEITAVDRDGRPLRCAGVGIDHGWRRTDLEGHAVFEAVPAGTHDIVLRERGFVTTVRPVVVRAGETTRTTLVEDVGGDLLVRVVDEEGRPLPAARLEVEEGHRVAWLDVEDGVQRLDLTTNARGERWLRRLPAMEVGLEATWGTREGRETVAVESGTQATVTLRLPREDEEPESE